jgi:hypothetical protein
MLIETEQKNDLADVKEVKENCHLNPEFPAAYLVNNHFIHQVSLYSD